jgi:hypothetical protein
VQRISLSPLLLVGTVAVGFVLACGPFGGSKTGSTETTHQKGSSTKNSSGQTSGSARNDGPSGGVAVADVDCGANFKEPKASCAIRSIACGDTVQGTNKGQGSHFGDDFYRAKFCTPRRASYEDGPEAIYALTVPANMQADIHLSSPCEDLDLFSVRHQNPDSCPTPSTSTGECEGSTNGDSDSIRIVSVGRDEHHLVWVDGKKGTIGNFELRVDCRPAR